jgi:inorganic pyrophosphatase
VDDVPPHFLEEVTHFFNVYKDLEAAEVYGRGWEGIERAHEEIERALEMYVRMLRTMR